MENKYIEKTMGHLNSGELKIIFRNISRIVLIGSDDRWKKSMAGVGGNKRIYQYCTDSSGIILYLRALQGHSGRSLVDLTLQDNVLLFRATSSRTLIMSDVQSIYIPSIIRD